MIPWQTLIFSTQTSERHDPMANLNIFSTDIRATWSHGKPHYFFFKHRHQSDMIPWQTLLFSTQTSERHDPMANLNIFSTVIRATWSHGKPYHFQHWHQRDMIPWQTLIFSALTSERHDPMANLTIFNTDIRATWSHGKPYFFQHRHQSDMIPWQTLIFSAQTSERHDPMTNHTIFNIDIRATWSHGKPYYFQHRHQTDMIPWQTLPFSTLASERHLAIETYSITKSNDTTACASTIMTCPSLISFTLLLHDIVCYQLYDTSRWCKYFLHHWCHISKTTSGR